MFVDLKQQLKRDFNVMAFLALSISCVILYSKVIYNLM
jgi:hypothetical protein